MKYFKASLHNQINLIKFGLTAYDKFKVEMETIIEICSTKNMFLLWSRVYGQTIWWEMLTS